ncbi:hypothetical protein FRB95_002897 [Tulasnella sp. JGI-2019a]|nr:hypothetical protein FRB95_002897 [Tulasnella sp. JGI-2019a]
MTMTIIPTEGNYHPWAAQVEAHIISTGSWECIDPGWKKPVYVDLKKPTENECCKWHKWNKAQGVAKGAILETVLEANCHIIEGKDTKDAWDALKAAHNVQSAGCQFQLI